MSTIHGTDNLAWNDEQTRFYLELRLEEKLKGNIRNQIVNDVYGERHPWKKFGIKFTTCKKQYEAFRKLIHNRTGLGYYPNGSIKMSDDWWNELCKEWPGARKIKEKPMANVDLMEKVFGKVHISGAEGWAPKQGEEKLDTMHQADDDDDDDDAISVQIPPTQDDDVESRQILPTQSNVGNGPSSTSKSRTSKKRSRSVQAEQVVAEVIKDISL